MGKGRRTCAQARACDPARIRPRVTHRRERDRDRSREVRSGADGAGEGTRTLDINLGKVALYQLSYARTIEGGILPRYPECAKHRATPRRGDAHGSQATSQPLDRLNVLGVQ